MSAIRPTPRVCSQFSQPDEGTREMNERQKGRCEFVVARGNTPEVLDASEEAFDQIAVSIEMAIEVALGKAIGAGRNQGFPNRLDELCRSPLESRVQELDHPNALTIQSTCETRTIRLPSDANHSLEVCSRFLVRRNFSFRGRQILRSIF